MKIGPPNGDHVDGYGQKPACKFSARYASSRPHPPDDLPQDLVPQASKKKNQAFGKPRKSGCFAFPKRVNFASNA